MIHFLNSPALGRLEARPRYFLELQQSQLWQPFLQLAFRPMRRE